MFGLVLKTKFGKHFTKNVLQMLMPHILELPGRDLDPLGRLQLLVLRVAALHPQVLGGGAANGFV